MKTSFENFTNPQVKKKNLWFRYFRKGFKGLKFMLNLSFFLKALLYLVAVLLLYNMNIKIDWNQVQTKVNEDLAKKHAAGELDDVPVLGR